MKVSVCTITYNQGPFIAEALESILRQKVDFDFEIVVGDDASTDNTVQILKEFQARYPGIIRLILRDPNVGLVSNFFSTIAACTGDYIAICEGDDFWTDDNKLMRQVEFLEKNPDFAICFHRCQIVFSGMDPIPFPDYNEHTPAVTTFSDLVKGNYIHTPTCMFRNHLFESIPPALLELKVGDWSLHLLNARKGNIYFMNEEMAAYRVSNQGFWSVRNQINKIEYAIRFLTEIQPFFESKYTKEFQSSIGGYARYLLKLYAKSRNYRKLLSEGPSLLVKSMTR